MTAHDSAAMMEVGALAPGETIPSGEAAAVATITAAIETVVRRAAMTAPARRDAHAKAHGCVRATFTVAEALPEALRVGVFARPATFQAWVRFSNGSGDRRADRLGDGRGMAIKLMDVPGSPSGTQDFVMINHPVFFVRNAVDYVSFQTASNPLQFFFGLNPFRWRLHEFRVATAIAGQRLSNPLDARYWSMTPYALGAGGACKYSARPAGPPSPFGQTVGVDFLHDNLVAHLAAGEAVFDFLLQPRASPRLPIEDPTLDWPEADAPFVKAATLRIPRQTFDSAANRAFCENLSFTPWHGLAAHRPLGGVNRVRRTVYDTVSRVRHAINGEPRLEPTSGDPERSPVGSPSL